MSNQLSGASLLYAMVLENSDGCALVRAARGLGVFDRLHSDLRFNLSHVGEQLGFTRRESAGIMAGWDDSIGHYSTAESVTNCSRPGNPDEFDRGYEIGKNAARIAGVAL